MSIVQSINKKHTFQDFKRTDTFHFSHALCQTVFMLY